MIVEGPLSRFDEGERITRLRRERGKRVEFRQLLVRGMYIGGGPEGFRHVRDPCDRIAAADFHRFRGERLVIEQADEDGRARMLLCFTDRLWNFGDGGRR